MVGPCWLSILHIAVCTCLSQLFSPFLQDQCLLVVLIKSDNLGKKNIQVYSAVICREELGSKYLISLLLTSVFKKCFSLCYLVFYRTYTLELFLFCSAFMNYLLENFLFELVIQEDFFWFCVCNANQYDDIEHLHAGFSNLYSIVFLFILVMFAVTVGKIYCTL